MNGDIGAMFLLVKRLFHAHAITDTTHHLGWAVFNVTPFQCMSYDLIYNGSEGPTYASTEDRRIQ